MTNSLKDQLMGLGFKPAPKPERRPERTPDERGRKPQHGKGGAPGKPGGKGPQRGRDGAPAGEGQGARPPHGRGPRDRGGKPGGRKPGGGPRSQEDIDLAKAYAIRAQKEKQERIDAEQAKQEAARIRREARAKFDALIDGQALNVPDAEHARHFEYGGKIKRVYCTQEQIRQLNAGELFVGQQKGRYLLLPVALLAEAKATFPDGIALEVDPNAAPGDDPYADPQYQVPDDLIW